ncbi:MAG: hypothetical protein KME53_18750, partial [Candidatus Thiodiazotropha sp. (ex Clathrolucina costata)]|nr:hypothetical protein [Candidatus Thiodiazotropha taylori]
MRSHQKSGWFPLASLLLVMVLGQQAGAQESGVRLSQSVEGRAAASVATEDAQLDQADLDEHQALVVSGSRMEATAQRSFAAHAPGRLLSIFDAHSVISRDDDDDG